MKSTTSKAAVNMDQLRRAGASVRPSQRTARMASEAATSTRSAIGAYRSQGNGQ